jgi:hypothetical protein
MENKMAGARPRQFPKNGDDTTAGILEKDQNGPEVG